MNEKDYYGQDFSVIHLKFGDARKMYFFTKEFATEHPTFCAEYKKYWNRDPKGQFENPMQIVNYVEQWGIPVEFYFNYTDTPAESLREVKEYFMREAMPRDMGKFVGNKMVGWDGEKEVEVCA